MTAMSVHLIATLDTKGVEADFVRKLLASFGVESVLIDAGCLGEPQCDADIKREQVFAAAGCSLKDLRQQGEREVAVTAASRGVRALLLEQWTAGKLSGVLGLGGSAGTTIATEGMRALPLGVPKLMVSTLASGQVRNWVGDKDITMVNSVVDILGINRISRRVLGNAAAAMAGMVLHSLPPTPDSERPLVALTMFGVTTPCAEQAKKSLEQAGYEVLVFHATGSGGDAMETLIRDGVFAGVLDLTTTELADELVGGFLSAGPGRLTAAAECEVPQVVSVGATDMVNFHALESVPERFNQRKFHSHNASVTLMRTTAEECAAIGADLGRKVASSKGPCEVHLPNKGVSAIDRQGEDFDDPIARAMLFDTIRAHARHIPVVEHDYHINDPEFASAIAGALIRLIEKPK